MPKRNYSEQGHLISEKQENEKFYTNGMLRPQRVVFLLNPESNFNELLEIFTFNSMIWGGIFNLLIPVGSNDLDSSWFINLENYDPDLIITNMDLPPTIQQSINELIQPLRVIQWHSEILDFLLEKRFDKFGNVPIEQIFLQFYEESKPITNSNCTIVDVESQDVNSQLIVAMLQGQFTTSFQDNFVNAFKAEVLSGNQFENINTYLEFLNTIDHKFLPVYITGKYLKTSHFLDSSFSPPTPRIILVNYDTLKISEILDDLCAFWNFRVCAFGKRPVFIIPYFNEEHYVESLSRWINDNKFNSNTVLISSKSISKDTLLKLKAQLKENIKPSITRIDIQFDNYQFPRFINYFEEFKSRPVLKDGNTYSIQRTISKLEENLSSGIRHILELSYPSTRKVSFIFPCYKGINALFNNLNKFTGVEIKQKARSTAIKIQNKSEQVWFRLPTTEQLIFNLFQEYDYEIEVTDKCRYTNGMIQRLGGDRELNAFQDKYFEKLIKVLYENDAISLNNIFSKIRAGKNKETCREHLRGLLHKQIVLRGYSLHCPVCDLRSWYPSNELSEMMFCAGCLSPIQPGIEINFYYRLNQLFVRGLEQGCLPVLMTINTLSMLSFNGFFYLPGVEVLKNGKKVDLDIVAICDGMKIVCECKDLSKGAKDGTISEIKSQLQDIATVAKEINADVVLFSCFLDKINDIPADLKLFLDDIRNKNPNISFVVFTREELENRDLKLTLDDWMLIKNQTKAEGFIKDDGSLKVSF